MKKTILTILTIPMWVIYLISKFIPRNSSLVVFGIHTHSFSGNIKALFLNKDNSRYKKVFISDDQSLVEQLNNDKHIAYTKYSMQGILHSLRAGTYIYSGFPSDINFWLSSGAKYINVWHGTPIKKIERDVTTGKYSLKNKYPWIFKILKPYLLAKPDVLLVASAYEEKHFLSAFDMNNENIFRAFPPRLESFIEKDHASIQEKNILYVPTWRDDHSFNFSDYINLETFNTFLKKNQLKFNIKLHPSDKSIEDHNQFSNIEIIDQNKDVYDNLKDTAILVSDYSSMVFEALYLSKPVVLFCPDYDTYQQNSREFYIDPCSDLPVEVSFEQEELEKKLLQIDSTSINIDKLKPYEPYDEVNDLLEKLIKKAHS